jgi:hypothetical protein
MAGQRLRHQLDSGIAMEFGHAQAVPAAVGGAFEGLSPREQRTLAGWVAGAREGGIDTAEDLGLRPWPGVASETIIGIFRSGHLLASWLIVGHAGCWAVASCGDSVVSPRVASLAEALALVYSPAKGAAAKGAAATAGSAKGAAAKHAPAKAGSAPAAPAATRRHAG